MTIQEMKKRKQELGYTNEDLSLLTGVPLGTIMKIFGGATKAPRRSTIEALERVLFPEIPGADMPVRPGHGMSGNDAYDTSRSSSPGHYAGMVRETALRYAGMLRMEQGDVDAARLDQPHRLYTVEDYYALPDDIRTELIDGVFYDMSSPSVTHQLVIGELFLQLKACEKKHKGKCRVILSPCDVQLNQDQHTMVQPDLLVVCDSKKIEGRNCFGAPDLCIEVLSPSSKSHDCVLKLNKYKSSGIREYWIVDPEHRKVIVYWFDSPDMPTFETYSFTDEIPVRISGGDCLVNMKEVLEALQ